MKNIPIRHITSSRHKTLAAGSFNIRDVREMLAGKDMVQELHRHAFFYLLALKKGKGVHTIDFIPYDVRDHSVFFVRPGQVHQLTLKAGSTGYLMGFNGDFYQPHDKASRQLLRKASGLNHYHLEADGLKKVLSILTNIFQEHTDKQEGYQEVIKANLAVLFIELVRQNSKNLPANTIHSYAQERLEKFQELLEKHVAEHKQVADYADMLNLSPYQLNAITKTTLEKTSSELINEYIILEAKRYILATSSQVNQIAHQLGYDDVSYFIRFFRKHTGHSPEAFRNNFR